MLRRNRTLAVVTLLGASTWFTGCGSSSGGSSAPSGALVPVEAPVLWFEGAPVHTGWDATSAAQTALDGTWAFREDPGDVGEAEGWMDAGHDRSSWREIAVPGTWNLAFGEELFRYKGAGWYARTFAAPAGTSAETSVRLRFEAVFLHADVWVNGVHLGRHRGGYTPFELDVSAALVPGENLLVVRADNRLTRTTIPCLTLAKPDGHGWYPYGGITRGVRLLADGGARPFKVDVRTTPAPPGGAPSAAGGAPPLPVDRAGPWTATVTVGVHGTSPAAASGPVEVELLAPGDGEVVARLRAGAVRLAPGEVATLGGAVTIDDVRPWSRADPDARYRARVRYGDAWAEESFGFRTVAVAGGEILLSGEPQTLLGVSRHEDHATLGPVTTPELADGDVALLRDLAANHVRPGHYAAHPRFLRALAGAGITVTEEAPIYQLDLGQLGNADMLADATFQMLEMIERDRNEPAIVLWSLQNESWSFFPVAGEFIRALRAEVLRFDDTRPLTAAILTVPVASDLLDFMSPELDVISLNEYWGWYFGTTGGLGGYLDRYHRRFPDHPMILSEFGAGSVDTPNYPGAPAEEPVGDHSYSHDYHRWFLERHLEQAWERDFVVGTMPWAFADFRMEWVQTTGKPHPQALTNLKGLVRQDRTRKPAFDTVRERYAGLAAASR